MTSSPFAVLALVVVCGCGSAKPATADTLATGDGNFLRLAADASGVYWTVAGTTGEGKIMHVGSAVGSKPTELVTKLAAPLAIALDANAIYFTNEKTTGGAVDRVNKTGGTPAELVGSQQQLTSLVVVGDAVYFTDLHAGTVSSVPAAGGAAMVLAHGQAQPDGLASDTLNLYWVNTGADTIEKIDEKVSSTVADVAKGIANPGRKVAVEPTSNVIVWTSLGANVGADGAVMTSATATSGTTTGTPTAIASDRTIGADGAIAVDGSGAYWFESDGYDYTIQHALLTGGTAEPIATGSAAALFDIVAYGGNLYWLESDGQKSYVKTVKK